MKLIEVKLTNFRGYAKEVCIQITPLTVLIGKNDAGKSTILDALDIYFNDASIDGDDRCVRTEQTEVRIACVFDDLPETVIADEQYETTLRAEYLLRADGKLEIVKIYDCNGAKGKLTGVFARATHPTATGFEDLLTLKIAALKIKAKTNGLDLSTTNQTAKAPLRKAIWDAEHDLKLAEIDVSLKTESAKDLFEKIQNYMPIFAVFKSDRASTDQDAEAQDPLKAAIKEAIRSRESELNGVIAEIKKELESVAARTVEKIREMSPELASQLHPTVKNKNWDSLFNVTLTGDDDIPINKRGGGTRRLILLNFFRAKAEEAAQGKTCGVIYAVEEPETSQHPNHQLMLLEAFERLVEQGQCQMLLTTHTPTLARRVDQNYLRLITTENGEPVIKHGSEEETLKMISGTLGVLPDHDIKVFFGVEGKHDITFLKNISALLAITEYDIPDLSKAESAGKLVFVPLGGSSLELWANRLKGLNRKEFYLTDRDDPPPKSPKYETYANQWTARGCTAWITSKRELENYLHKDILIACVPTYGGSGDAFDDVPLLFAEAVHNAASCSNPWAEVSGEKRKAKISNAKKQLNGELSQQMTPQLLSLSDPNDELRNWLRAVGKELKA